MVAGTRMLPIMDMGIRGAFRTQFMMTIVSGRVLLLPISPELSIDWFAIFEFPFKFERVKLCFWCNIVVDMYCSITQYVYI